MEKKKVLIKYGGNAMTDPKLQRGVVSKIKSLADNGYQPILVHGGGPFIEEVLKRFEIKSHFNNGLRYTSEEAIPYVETALRGLVNGNLTGLCLKAGIKAVGLSGKDGFASISQPQTTQVEGKETDLGRVGTVKQVDTHLYQTLLDGGFTPVLASIACNEKGEEYNVNADWFAAEIARALRVDYFLVLTNTEGLLEDANDENTLIHEVSEQEVRAGKIDIFGGMLPKLDACFHALNGGVGEVRIINGQKPERILESVAGEKVGTRCLL